MFIHMTWRCLNSGRSMVPLSNRQRGPGPNVPGSIVTTSIRFDTVRGQILQEAVATEASYSQVPCPNPSSVCSFTRCMMYVNVCLFERFLTRLSPTDESQTEKTERDKNTMSQNKPRLVEKRKVRKGQT